MPVLLTILAFVLAEIAGFILVGKIVGVLPTLAGVLFGVVAGLLVLRWQGVQTLIRVRADLAARRAPTTSLADGAGMAVVALLFMIPGFISDLLGLMLLIPVVRAAALRAVRDRFFAVMRSSARDAARPAFLDLDRSEYRPRPQRGDTPWGGPGT